MTLQTQPIPVYQKSGRVWLQRTEGTPYYLFSNAGMTNITWPAAAPTQIRAQSTSQRQGSDTIDVTLGDKDLASFSIPTRLAATLNHLMALEGEQINVQLLTGPTGDPTTYGATQLGLGWVLAMRGAGTSDGGAIVDNAGEGVPVAFESPFSAVMGPIPIDWGVALSRISTAETEAMQDIFTLPVLKDFAPARKVVRGQVGMIVSDSAVGPATAGIYYFDDGMRASPTAVAGDPFAAGVGCKSVVGYGDKLESRFIVSAETQAGAAPQIAYTDDKGATWTAVNAGAVNADEASKLWLVSASYIVAVGGQAGSSKIWISKNGAASWTEYDPGLSQPLNDVKVMGNGYGMAVGDSNTVAVAENFDNFASVTGPAGGAGDAILAVGIKPSTGTTYIGNDAGELYMTQDHGATWTDVSTSIEGVTATSINHIEFDTTGEYGFMEVSTAASRVMLRTTDGGNSWKQYQLGNAGMANIAKNGLHVAGPNHVMAVGAASGGTASIVLGETNFDGNREGLS